jgi:GTP-binding protein HflX
VEFQSHQPKKTTSDASVSEQEAGFVSGAPFPVRFGRSGKILPSARVARSAASPHHTSEDTGRNPFSVEDSMAELRELTISAGATVIGQFVQRRSRPDPATLIGSGKLEELKGAAASSSPDLIIFDHDLTPSQQRNLERELDARVVDRTQLILDIFARHARTREGQMQVELAQLEYLLPRLAGRGAQMSQLGGGIGTRGPGETQLETDRRKIYRRVRHVKQQLENVRRIRGQQRQRRESAPIATVALVGYTNAGKSTLFNALTKAGVLESSRMFATLDPTLRSVTLPSRRQVLLSDTVGFLRNLPHTLVSAFRATLEEVQRASLLLHVEDVMSSAAQEQRTQVDQVLRELESADKPRVHVINKVDLLSEKKREELRDSNAVIHVSASGGLGLDSLLQRIDDLIIEDPLQKVVLRLPQSEGKSLAAIEAKSRILGRKYHDGYVDLEVQAPESLLRKMKSFIIRK